MEPALFLKCKKGSSSFSHNKHLRVRPSAILKFIVNPPPRLCHLLFDLLLLLCLGLLPPLVLPLAETSQEILPGKGVEHDRRLGGAVLGRASLLEREERFLFNRAR